MEVLRVGLEKIAQKVEQGVDKTHEHQKMEVMTRKRECQGTLRKHSYTPTHSISTPTSIGIRTVTSSLIWTFLSTVPKRLLVDITRPTGVSYIYYI